MEPNDRSRAEVHSLTIIGLGRALELAVSDTGLSSTGYRALSLVHAGITSSGLVARFLDVQPSTVTTVMDGLVAEQLVARIRGESDRRRVDYALTERGEAVLAQATAAADDALTTLAAHLDTAERDRATDGLDLWSRAIEARRRSHWGALER